MGQQQLLLVILVTIIVGIATVVAINTFSSASESANVDAVRQNMLSLASSAQQYYMKPEALGGGGQKFTNMTLENLGGVPGEVTGSSGSYTLENENGTFTISTSDQSFTITGTPSSDAGDIPAYVGPDCINMGDVGGDAPSSCDGGGSDDSSDDTSG